MIRIRGARTHNLKGLDLDLPLKGIVALTGVSGSGKTSLALGTLHATARRRYMTAMGGRVLEEAPPVDLVAGLPPTLAVPARPAVPKDTTVAEASGLTDLLAVLFAKCGAVVPRPGAPPLPCSTVEQVAEDLSRLPEGTKVTVLAPLWRGRRGDGTALLEELRLQGFARVRIDGRVQHLDGLRRLPTEAPDLDLVVDRVRVRKGRHERLEEAARGAFSAGSGRLLALIEQPGGAMQERSWADHPWDPSTNRSWSSPRAAHLDRRRLDGRCAACGGAGCSQCEQTGHHPLASVLTLGDQTWLALQTQSLQKLSGWLERAAARQLAPLLVASLEARLEALTRLGLGHLPLDRRAAELSAGEVGRLVLVERTQMDLTDVLIVLDEPSSGLSAEDVPLLVRYLKGLRERGHPLLLIDHHPSVLALADHIVEFGPGAGHRGGTVLYTGSLEGLRKRDTPTARALLAQTAEEVRPAALGADPGPVLVLKGATGRNLQSVDLAVPLGALTVVTGPSGAGKRSLVDDTLGTALAKLLNGADVASLPHERLEVPPELTRLVRLQRGAAGRSPRSCVATACGAWTPIRSLFAQTREAKLRGFGSEHFSFNTQEGRCPTCLGLGTVEERVPGLTPVQRVCPACEGGRLARASRIIRWKGHTAHALLRLDVDAALLPLSAHRRIRGPLEGLVAVGLGHLPLGRSLGSLSGGEQQRLQLARELARAGDPGRLDNQSLRGTIMVLESPLSGLHPEDAAGVAGALRRMADAGATLVCAETDPALLRVADQVVRLGPGAGSLGGRVLP